MSAFHRTRFGNRKRRSFFRWQSAESTDAQILRAGRRRIGQSGVLGMHRKIEREKSRDDARRAAQRRAV